MNKTILNTNSLNEEIAEKTMNWDKDRIANIDLVLLQMAITELKKFNTKTALKKRFFDIPVHY